MYIILHVKYPLFLTEFNETLISLIDSKVPQILHFMKIGPVGAEVFHADEQTKRRDESKFYEFA